MTHDDKIRSQTLNEISIYIKRQGIINAQAGNVQIALELGKLAATIQLMRPTDNITK